jgi:hypothetical protein
MISTALRYTAPLLRTWNFLSQSRFWLKQPPEQRAEKDCEASLSQPLSATQQVQRTCDQGQWLDPLDKQPPEVHLRSLMVLCRGLTRQYQSTPEIVLDRWWWRSLHQAGVRLRAILEETRACQDAFSLPRQELEQAYLMLIHVAYFFEPGGVAEVVCKEQGWFPEAQEFRRF